MVRLLADWHHTGFITRICLYVCTVTLGMKPLMAHRVPIIHLPGISIHFSHIDMQEHTCTAAYNKKTTHIHKNKYAHTQAHINTHRHTSLRTRTQTGTHKYAHTQAFISTHTHTRTHSQGAEAAPTLVLAAPPQPWTPSCNAVSRLVNSLRLPRPQPPSTPRGLPLPWRRWSV